jgi:hypothetical protein
MVYEQILQRLLYIKFYDNSLSISMRAGMTNRQAEVEKINICSRSALISWKMCQPCLQYVCICNNLTFLRPDYNF